MNTSLKLFVVALLVVGVVCERISNPSTKVHANIHKYFTTHAHAEKISSILLLKDVANVDAAVLNVPFNDRGQVVFEVLTKKAATTQPPVIAALESLGVAYRTYWLVNMIVIESNYSMILAVAGHPAIGNIHPNFEFLVDLETPEFVEQVHMSTPDAIEWNVARVKAPNVWDLGINGKGFVVAGADTGVQWDHPALKGQYRGSTSASVDHNYNWWDAIHTTGSRCGANAQAPCDDNGHGTHTVGTMVGTDHANNQIGVAPGAQWIACRNMNAGYGTPTTYIECLQFFVAPTDLTGQNPDPTKRPHAIGNSYGCPTSEGCVADSLQTAVDNVIAAGIFMAVSAGNDGPSCSTVNTPPGLYQNVYSVGALAMNSNTIASYSSRGPVTVDKSGILKPEISAPGSSVRSSYPTNTYATLSGTSMASPHITGIITLLYQSTPTLVRDIAATQKTLSLSALALASTACGGNSTQNNVYGYGAVDALAAVKYNSF